MARMVFLLCAMTAMLSGALASCSGEDKECQQPDQQALLQTRANVDAGEAEAAELIAEEEKEQEDDEDDVGNPCSRTHQRAGTARLCTKKCSKPENQQNEGSCPPTDNAGNKCVWYPFSAGVTGSGTSKGQIYESTGRCTSFIQEVVIGGTASSEEFPGQYHTHLVRPMHVTTERAESCTQGGGDCDWQSCTGTANCWHGTNGDKLTSTLDGDHVKSAAQVQVKCVDGAARAGPSKIKIVVDSSSIDNAVLSVWYNKISYTTPSNGLYDIDITPGDDFPVLRIEMGKQVNSGAASGTVSIELLNVSPVYDKCMEASGIHNVCLDNLEQTGLDITELRNSHVLQLYCLQSTSTVNPCTAWKDCLAQGAAVGGIDEDILKNMLTASLDTSSSSLLETTKGRNGRLAVHDCINPSTFDVEAYECSCLDKLWKCTSGATSCVAPDKVAKTAPEMRALFCSSPKVCQGWKTTTRCPSSALLQTRANISQKGANAEALDRSVLGKASCD